MPQSMTKQIKDLLEERKYLSLDEVHQIAYEEDHKQSTVERIMRNMCKKYEHINATKNHKGFLTGYRINDERSLKEKVEEADAYMRTITLTWDNAEEVKSLNKSSKDAKQELTKVRPEKFFINPYLNEIKKFKEKYDK